MQIHRNTALSAPAPAVPTLTALMLTVLAFTTLAPTGLSAQENTDPDWAQVVDVQVRPGQSGTWSFDVTIEHNDTGWEHYADAWQVLDAQTGALLGERELLHPHVNEMPFTRSLTGVQIPTTVTEVRIRGRCNVHGYGGKEMIVSLR